MVTHHSREVLKDLYRIETNAKSKKKHTLNILAATRNEASHSE
jgi:hypothetical protein